jgi:hypothetical protein
MRWIIWHAAARPADGRFDGRLPAAIWRPARPARCSRFCRPALAAAERFRDASPSLAPRAALLLRMSTRPLDARLPRTRARATSWIVGSRTVGRDAPVAGRETREEFPPPNLCPCLHRRRAPICSRRRSRVRVPSLPFKTRANRMLCYLDRHQVSRVETAAFADNAATVVSRQMRFLSDPLALW